MPNEKDNAADRDFVAPLSGEMLYAVLSRAASVLGMQSERSQLDLEQVNAKGLTQALANSGRQLGLSVRPSNSQDVGTLMEIVGDGCPILIHCAADNLFLLRSVSGSRIDATRFDGENVANVTMRTRGLKKLLLQSPNVEAYVFQRELGCDPISGSPVHDKSSHTSAHISPTKRFIGLLHMDAQDIWTVALFALVSGILGLATPLAIESLVNVVSWGIYLQPLLILALILLISLGLAATLRVLQTIVVEVIQRRQLVRIASDLAHRFPRANQQYLVGEYPRELANRVFDIMTIQKATSTLLLDGVSILLTTLLGLLLLAFYHPFLLGFDIVLLICMISITWLLGRGGIRTAVKESKTKYRIAHWLQDVLSSPTAFRINGGEALAIDRANRLATEYVQARKAQFRVVLRQVIFAVGLQVVASTALLGLGGWLVIEGQLTLGQLVASELVVTTVVGAFAKAGKTLEKYYDLMAGIDKVGHLLDIPTDQDFGVVVSKDQALELKWDDLRFLTSNGNWTLPETVVSPGESVAILVDDISKIVMDTLAGLHAPSSGRIEIDGNVTSSLSSRSQSGHALGYASKPEIFFGSVKENIDLGRSHVERARTREVLQGLDLWDAVGRLPDGLNTELLTGGYPLTETQCSQLMIARACLASPGVVLVDDLLDSLSPADLDTTIEFLLREKCTVVVSTQHNYIAERFDAQVRLLKR